MTFGAILPGSPEWHVSDFSRSGRLQAFTEECETGHTKVPEEWGKKMEMAPRLTWPKKWPPKLKNGQKLSGIPFGGPF